MDVDALEIARENIASVEMEDEITLVHAQLPSRDAGDSPAVLMDDSIAIFDPTTLDRKIDTVIMNPPFGTWNKVCLCSWILVRFLILRLQGIDMVFLEVATQVFRLLYDS